MLFALAMITYVIGVAGDWTDCPPPCTCKWTSGKKSAFCRQANFSYLPNSLDSDIQILDLTGNHLIYIEANAFKTLGLVNLQRIYLKSSKIKDVHRDAFKDLTILIEIDLSDNYISSFHGATFTGNDRLKALYLNSNPLTELMEAQFPILPHLKSLDMQNCRIKYVHQKAFINLHALESLSLNGNSLTMLSETVFRSLGKLKSLSLDGNPWKCDCLLKGFRNWLLSSNLYSHSLSCSEPGLLAAEHWEDLNPREFACPPVVNLSETSIRGEPGENVTLRCGVKGEPRPFVAWMLNGNLIDNGTDLKSMVDDDSYETGGDATWTTYHMVIQYLTEADAGDYSCVARNIRGQAVGNVSLVLPEVAVATTRSKEVSWPSSWRVWAGVVLGSSLAILSLTLLMILFSVLRQKPEKKVTNTSFGEQDKKLLEASITTTTDPQSTEGVESICESEVEMCEQPLHIRIESRTADMQVCRHQEFATVPPPFGNIYISVSLAPEPDATKYPDLLDHSMRTSVASGSDTPLFSTLPRRARPKVETGTLPEWDNMGRRVTAAGSSTLSLPDAADIPPPPPPPLVAPLTIEYVSL